MTNIYSKIGLMCAGMALFAIGTATPATAYRIYNDRTEWENDVSDLGVMTTEGFDEVPIGAIAAGTTFESGLVLQEPAFATILNTDNTVLTDELGSVKFLFEEPVFAYGMDLNLKKRLSLEIVTTVDNSEYSSYNNVGFSTPFYGWIVEPGEAPILGVSVGTCRITCGFIPLGTKLFVDNVRVVEQAKSVPEPPLVWGILPALCFSWLFRKTVSISPTH
ncbi:MAG TPA: hypothetical protein V6C85_35270 [Allocoleopsis sp.]